MSEPLVSERNGRKLRQIIGGAKATFHEHGFEGASVDEIARRARVSKATLYNYFPDKRALFSAVMRAECEEQAKRIFEIDPQTAGLEATLRDVARKFVAFLLSPFALSMFRTAIAEAQRFPEFGHAFYRSGPELGIQRLSALITAAAERGELRAPDPELAAHQFTELCKAELFYKRLLGVKDQISACAVQRLADEAVATFLRAYRPSSPVTATTESLDTDS